MACCQPHIAPPAVVSATAEIIPADTGRTAWASAELLLTKPAARGRLVKAAYPTDRKALPACCQNAETNADKTNLLLLTKYTHPAPLKGAGVVLSACSGGQNEGRRQQTEVAR